MGRVDFNHLSREGEQIKTLLAQSLSPAARPHFEILLGRVKACLDQLYPDRRKKGRDV